MPIALTALSTLALGAIPASADNLQNDAATTAGITTITAGGSTTITYTLVGNSSPQPDPNGCDATTTNPVTVTIHAPAGVTAPASLSFTGCGTGNTQTATFTSSAAGSYNITHSTSGGVNDSQFKNQADFTLHVNPATPANTAPTLSLPSDITTEATGPNGATVTYTATASDAEDGTLTPTCNPVSGSTFPLGITQVNCSVTDSGGLTTTGMFNVTVVDTTSPTITFHGQSPTANANGWNNTSVTLTWDCSDLVSGNWQVTQTLANEGANQSATGTCTDSSGNSASNTRTGINIDETPPSVAYASASPAPNADGWNNTNVTATFTATDHLSGFSNNSLTQTGTATTSGEGSAVTVGSPAFTDLAGNTAIAGTATSDPFKIDKTPPALSPSVSPNPVLLNGSATAAAGASDSLSGVASQSCDPVDTSAIGTRSVSCAATDTAGNSVSGSASYSVLYRWDGFLQPINDTAHQIGLSQSVFKAGSTVPVKLQLKDANGTSVQGLTAPQWLAPQKGSSMTASVDETVYTTPATTGNSFVYDPTTQTYQFNWQTPKNGAGSWWKVSVQLPDGTIQTVTIGLR